MKVWTSSLLAIACIFGISATSAQAEVKVGDRPTLKFQSTQGKRVTSEMLRGRLVVVDFWATWCGPCVAVMPDMLQLQRDYGDKGVQIIGISLDSNRRQLDQFVKQHGMTWPQYFDGQGWKTAYAQQWGVNSIPRVFLIGPDGTVLWTGHPVHLDTALEEAMKTHPPRLTGDEKAGPSDEVIERSVGSLKAAREAVDAGDLPAMLSAAAKVPDEALRDRRVIGHARVLMLKLKQPGIDLSALEAARAADAEGDKRLGAIIAAVAPGAAEHGATVLGGANPTGPSPHLVETKLKQAEQASQHKQYSLAYDRYEWLIEHATNTEAGMAAAQKIAAYEADPEIMKAIAAEQAEADARSMLVMASNYELAGKPELAKELYQKLLDQFSATDCAAVARSKLAAME